MTTWPTDPETRRLLDKVVRDLGEELAGVYDAATVRRYVSQAVELFPSPRLQDFLPTFARKYARDLLHSAARWQGKIAAERPQILFVCVHNAGRSQMAAAFARHLGQGRVDVLSAGSAPADDIHDNVRVAMREVGIELDEEFPKRLSGDFVRASDVVITMGCGDACPVFPGKRYEDWKEADPAQQGLAGVRLVRDSIRRRVVSLLAQLSIASRAGSPPA